ncbi:KATNB1-like protein 1 isoform X1 [Clavelina lepadiformis]|uniref:KATNB1-like protein 1 isoform X1 n=1 Tax=Clavelina lepadiformis TaxID=159417 RepID=UPI0040415335
MNPRIPEEVRNGHGVMVSILENRSMRLNAALTFWKKNDFLQLIAYLLRTDDDSVFVDLFPFITKCILEDEKVKQTKITLGACLELLPVLDRLLHKKYEDYVVVSLDFIRTMIKRWYMELRDMKNKNHSHALNSSLSLSPVYTKLLSMSEQIDHLSLKKGNIGSKAKVVQELLSQLK